MIPFSIEAFRGPWLLAVAAAAGAVWTVGAYTLGYRHCRSATQQASVERNLRAAIRDAEIRNQLTALNRRRQEIVREIEESCDIPPETRKRLEEMK